MLNNVIRKNLFQIFFKVSIDELLIESNFRNNIDRENKIKYFFTFNYLYYEPLETYLLNKNAKSSDYRIIFNSKKNDQHNVPAHSRLVLNLEISPRFIDNINSLTCNPAINQNNINKNELEVCNRLRGQQFNFLSSKLNAFNLKIKTKFQTELYKIALKAVNGNAQLLNKENPINIIQFDTFPNEQFELPIKIQSNFMHDLKIAELEFGNFGNLFSFKWNDYKSFLKANRTTFIGSLEFDSKQLCTPTCYLGLEPKIKSSSSIIDITSINVKELSSLENLDESFLYELWIKSLNFEEQSKQQLTNSAFDLDKKLLDFYSKRWSSLTEKKNTLYRSNFLLSLHSENNQNVDMLLNYNYPIKFHFKWPHFAAKKLTHIEFTKTQIYSNIKMKNITLINPSNSTVFMQIILLDTAYASRNDLLELLNTYPNIFNNQDVRTQKLIGDYEPLKNDTHSLFSINIKHSIFIHQHLAGGGSGNSGSGSKKVRFEIENRKNNIVLMLEGHQSTTLQIKFRPEKFGIFQSYLLIRNNLTILDSYLIHAEVGSAKLKINDLKPLKTSLLVNTKQNNQNLNQQQENNNNSLLIRMSDLDFQLCKQQPNIKGFNTISFWSSFGGAFSWHKPMFGLVDLINNLNYNKSELEADWNEKLFPAKRPHDHYTSEELDSKSIRLKQGILLRNYFQMKNHGNMDLNVYHILLDGQPCTSRGFEIAYCLPFTVSHGETNNTAIIEMRYQPDFTMNYAKKMLTLVTNIGELDYLIEVKIPSPMLATCHDSLPRPPLESYLFIIFVFLTIILLFIMFLASLIESKSIIEFHMNIYKRIFSIDEEKMAINIHEFIDDDDFQSRYEINMNNNNQKSNSVCLAKKNNSNNNVLSGGGKQKLKVSLSVDTSVKTISNEPPPKSPLLPKASLKLAPKSPKASKLKKISQQNSPEMKKSEKKVSIVVEKNIANLDSVDDSSSSNESSSQQNTIANKTNKLQTQTSQESAKKMTKTTKTTKNDRSTKSNNKSIIINDYVSSSESSSTPPPPKSPTQVSAALNFDPIPIPAFSPNNNTNKQRLKQSYILETSNTLNKQTQTLLAANNRKQMSENQKIQKEENTTNEIKTRLVESPTHTLNNNQAKINENK